MENFDSSLLKIGFLFEHPFGRTVINHLINKTDFCKRCGALCINCRNSYDWFAGKIQYVHNLKWENFESTEECFEVIEEKLQPLDVMVIIGVPEDILMETPELLVKYNIQAAIYPVEDGTWISSRQQMNLQMRLKKAGIQYAFPRPFCSLNKEDNPEKKIINKFIDQFRIGRPIINLSTKDGKILKTEIVRSSPCGATHFITQYLRNEQLNTWNLDPLAKRITVSLNKYPCIASHSRDEVLAGITRVMADKIAHDTLQRAFSESEIVD
jgi:thymidylate synthase